ncbi:MAG: acyl-CoA desaturase [Rubripirellula sp.]
MSQSPVGTKDPGSVFATRQPPAEQATTSVSQEGSPAAPLGGRDAVSIPKPAGVNTDRLYVSYVISFIAFHSLALLVFVPWFFSWTGVIVFALGVQFLGAIGIPICYHRLLTHRSFRTPKWFERFLVTIALCNGQETPARWVAWHRLHHCESDHQEDPHSPLVNFFWSHFQWLVYENRNTNKFGLYKKYARDILDDPYYMWLEKKPFASVAIFVAHGLLIYLLAYIGAGLYYGFGGEAFQLASSVFVWGVIARVVWVWHITWSVNSLSHMFGYRNHDTDDHSRNNWFVALITSGEGWHNNHHADQSSATVQHRWWEFDPNYYIIKSWSWIGLASHIVPPLHQRRAAQKRKADSKSN